MGQPKPEKARASAESPCLGHQVVALPETESKPQGAEDKSGRNPETTGFGDYQKGGNFKCQVAELPLIRKCKFSVTK